MDVSVIIATYNVERYIQRAVDSVLAQQGVSVEIIMVDDCSGDGTWNLISSMGDSRIKTIRLDSNSGPGAARNTGLAVARGEWIAILDGDDALAPGRLAACINRAKEKRADIAVDNLLVCREVDGAEFPMFPPDTFAALPELNAAVFIKGMLAGKNNYTLGYLKPVFSRAFMETHKLSYDPDIRIGEDYLLMLQALLSGARCAVEPAAGYRYTARAGSVSHRLSLSDVTRMLKADEQLLAHYALDNAARIAQSGRTKWLRRQYAFTQLVAAIKKKDGHGAIKAIASYPSCVWLLWQPIQVRLQRLVQ